MNRLLDVLWPAGALRSQRLWAIVDGARDHRIFSRTLEFGSNSCCLYAGDLAPELEIAAPYLIGLDQDDRRSERLIESMWGNSWGVFLRSDSSQKALRKHLRQFLTVRDEGQRRLIFRYYDPRVLRVYLPTCNAEELRTVFGPVGSFYMESSDPAKALVISVERGVLRVEEAPARLPAPVLSGLA